MFSHKSIAGMFVVAVSLMLGLASQANAKSWGNNWGNNWGSSSSYGNWGQQPQATSGNMGWGGSSVPSSQGRDPLAVRKGIVLDVQPTQIEVEASAAGRGTGGLIGGLIGMVVANNTGSNGLGQALAGVVGGLAGERIANATGKEMRDATQIMVQLDNGQAIAIVQEAGVSSFAVGDNVYLVGAAPATRVVKANVQTEANTTWNGPRP